MLVSVSTVLPGCASPTTETPVTSDIIRLAAGPELPFSKAVRAGQTIYSAGELGIDPATGALAPGGIEAETTQALANISATLEHFGAGLQHIVRCRVYLAEIEEWPAMNRAYVAAMGATLPARAAMGGVQLAKAARMEIECTAVAP